MKIIKIIFVFLIFIGTPCLHAQKMCKEYYKLNYAGNTNLKVRMFSDKSSVSPGSEFRLGFYFDLAYNWHTYSKEDSDSHMPTSLELRVPKGFKIVGEHWPQASEAPGKESGTTEKIYNKDFLIIYTIRAPETQKDSFKINSSLSWQCCDPTMCTMGGGELSVELKSGKDKKSKFHKLFK